MAQSNVLKLLLDYFPTAVHTGQCIVFISENWRVELREHQDPRFGQNPGSVPVIRVKVFKKALNGEIEHFIGVDKRVPFQEPDNADLVLETSRDDASKTIKKLIEFVENAAK